MPDIEHRRTYRLGKRIGIAGTAEIFRARLAGTQAFERTVAIKRMLPRETAQERHAEVFTNEARVMAALHHPNIVAVSDLTRDIEGRLVMVMELVEGVDLRKLIRTGPGPLPVAIYIVTELLRGLGHIHDRVGADGRPLGTNLFAVGVILYEAMTGKTLFTGDSQGMIMAAILRPRFGRRAPDGALPRIPIQRGSTLPMKLYVKETQR